MYVSECMHRWILRTDEYLLSEKYNKCDMKLVSLELDNGADGCKFYWWSYNDSRTLQVIFWFCFASCQKIFQHRVSLWEFHITMHHIHHIWLIDTLSKTFYSIPNFWNSSFYTSKVWNSLLALGMQCQNYLLKEVGIGPQFMKSIQFLYFTYKVRNWLPELAMNSNLC